MTRIARSSAGKWTSLLVVSHGNGLDTSARSFAGKWTNLIIFFLFYNGNGSVNIIFHFNLMINQKRLRTVAL